MFVDSGRVLDSATASGVDRHSSTTSLSSTSITQIAVATIAIVCASVIHGVGTAHEDWIDALADECGYDCAPLADLRQLRQLRRDTRDSTHKLQRTRASHCRLPSTEPLVLGKGSRSEAKSTETFTEVPRTSIWTTERPRAGSAKADPCNTPNEKGKNDSLLPSKDSTGSTLSSARIENGGDRRGAAPSRHVKVETTTSSGGVSNPIQSEAAVLSQRCRRPEGLRSTSEPETCEEPLGLAGYRKAEYHHTGPDVRASATAASVAAGRALSHASRDRRPESKQAPTTPSLIRRGDRVLRDADHGESTTVNKSLRQSADGSESLPMRQTAAFPKPTAVAAKRGAGVEATGGAGGPCAESNSKRNLLLSSIRARVMEPVASHRKGCSGSSVAEKEIQVDSATTAPSSQSMLELDHGGDGVPLKEHPKFAKYMKMLNVGLPKTAVAHKMTMDGLDSSLSGILDMDSDMPLPGELPMKRHPVYAKYVKMIAVGLPIDAVKHKCRMDGNDPSPLDGDADKPVQLPKTPEADSTRLRDHPKYAKYFRMLKVGLPREAVKHKMTQDGADPGILDCDPEKSMPKLPSAAAGSAAGRQPSTSKIQRKRLHWNELSIERIGEDGTTFWSTATVTEEAIIPSELVTLFVRDASNANRPSTARKRGPKSAQAPGREERITLVDRKRATNVGIALATIKTSYHSIAECLHQLTLSSSGCVLSEQMLQTLADLMPTTAEVKAVQRFTGKVERLGEAEQFFHAMMPVNHRQERVECLLFQLSFPRQVAEIRDAIHTLLCACNEVRWSSTLHRALKVALAVGNEMNGHDRRAKGFALSSLPKLSATKGFDGKTTVLHVVVQIMNGEDGSASSNFGSDMPSVAQATRISPDLLRKDVSELQASLRRLGRLSQTVPNSSSADPTDDTLATPESSSAEEHGVPSTASTDEFMHRAEGEVSALTAELDGAWDAYKDLLKFVGEDSSTPCEELFSLLNDFVLEFRKVMSTSLQSRGAGISR